MKTEDPKILRLLLLKKIQNEWSLKWKKNHGPDFDFSNLKSQNSFLDQLIIDIHDSIQQSDIIENEISISRDNLRRIFNKPEPSAWQSKTKKIISLYVNSENETVEIKPSDSKKPIIKNQGSLVTWIAILLIVSILIGLYAMKFNGEPAKLLTEESKYSEGYPAVLDFKSRIPEFSASSYKIKIENEKLLYKQNPEIINYKDFSKISTLTFFTPGIKHITLLQNNKIKKNCYYLVGTNNSWYGCARIKSAQNPDPYNMSISKTMAWFGEQPANNNLTHNYLTTPDLWKKIQNDPNLNNGTLGFPEKHMETSPKNFSRVLLMKAQKFGIDLDSVSISFKAVRANTITEDCMSFMLNIFDEELRNVELYSSNGCNTASNVCIANIDGKNAKHYNLFINPKINRILEDHKWHEIQISFKNKHILVYYDQKLVSDSRYNYELKEFQEIDFVFEGNGQIDDVKIWNSNSGKIISNETFEK